jgi:hypothetical protein
MVVAARLWVMQRAARAAASAASSSLATSAASSAAGSWTPFLLSLLTDVASRVCSASAHSATPPSPIAVSSAAPDATGAAATASRLVMSRLTPAEHNELGRRLSLFAFYLLRSPFFERFTKYVVVVP